MSQLILHHYPTSPFAEKVRLIMGYKKLAWHGVTIPMVMPKPDVVALTGGYRRTPLLQIGADVYCDTSLIATVLEHLQPQPALFPEPLKGLARIVAQWADGELFWAAMGYTLSPKGAAAMFDGITGWCAAHIMARMNAAAAAYEQEQEAGEGRKKVGSAAVGAKVGPAAAFKRQKTALQKEAAELELRQLERTIL